MSRDVPRPRGGEAFDIGEFSRKNHREGSCGRICSRYFKHQFYNEFEMVSGCLFLEKMLFQPDITQCFFFQAIGVASGYFEHLSSFSSLDFRV